jgi:GNAT superfamily N-acetyltransferase
MDRGPQFPYEFKYEPGINALTGDVNIHRVTAHHKKHGKVGHFMWDPEDGEIQDVKVHEDHRGKGVAEGMLLHARSLGILPEPVHSDDRSESGDAWAKKMSEKHGDELPPRRRDSSQGFSINWNEE